MAVDTAVKRHALVVLRVGGPPLPDGTVHAIDRATLVGIYAGNALAAPAVVLATATTPAQQRTLVEAADLEIDWTVALYDAAGAYVADITADCQAFSATRNLYRTLHGTATLTLSRTLLWGSQRVAPSVTLSSTAEALTYTWALGHWLTSIPTREVGKVPESYVVECYDLLMLADTLVGRTYTVATGTSYVAAVETILTTELGLPASSVGIDQEDAATTTTAPLHWLLDDTTTWLRVINDLLRALNYEGLWVDRDGRFRARPYVAPDQRGTTWFFDADAKLSTIVGELRSLVPARRGDALTSDPVDTPNVFTFVNNDIANDPPTVGDGIYTETNQTDGPTSVVQRGRSLHWQRILDFAANQAALTGIANQFIATIRWRINSTLELSTGPCPALWHFDIVDLVDSALGPHRRWAVEEWTLALPSGEMRHRWRDMQRAA